MPKLFMLLVGCSPAARNIEQHDVFFGIGETIKEVLQDAIASWPEAGKSFHVDAWREVTKVDQFRITVSENPGASQPPYLFFINLGGYKRGEFEEFHYKLITVAPTKNEAVKAAKQTAFFKHTGFRGATAHIDDRYGIDVDDVFLVREILHPRLTRTYAITIEDLGQDLPDDELHLGYFKPEKVDSWG